MNKKCYIHQKILFLTQHLHFFKIGILNIQHASSPATTYEPKNQKVLLGATKKNKFKNLCLNWNLVKKMNLFLNFLSGILLTKIKKQPVKLNFRRSQ